MHALSPILKTVEVTLRIQTSLQERKENMRKTVKSYVFSNGKCAKKNIQNVKSYFLLENSPSHMYISNKNEQKE